MDFLGRLCDLFRFFRWNDILRGRDLVLFAWIRLCLVFFLFNLFLNRASTCIELYLCFYSLQQATLKWRILLFLLKNLWLWLFGLAFNLFFYIKLKSKIIFLDSFWIVFFWYFSFDLLVIFKIYQTWFIFFLVVIAESFRERLNSEFGFISFVSFSFEYFT